MADYASKHRDTELFDKTRDKTFSCTTNNEFRKIFDRTPDPAFKTNLQIRLMDNFGLQYGAPWLGKSRSSTRLLCKDSNVEDIFHFLFACPILKR